MPQDLTDDKSTLVQIMAWCRQATSHYLGQCWPRSMSPNGVTRPQWVKSHNPQNADYYTIENDKWICREYQKICVGRLICPEGHVSPLNKLNSICEFKLELQSWNAQSQSNIAISMANNQQGIDWKNAMIWKYVALIYTFSQLRSSHIHCSHLCSSYHLTNTWNVFSSELGGGGGGGFRENFLIPGAWSSPDSEIIPCFREIWWNHTLF